MRPLAFLDANVLFGANARDTLLWPAFRLVYQARFSDVIHEEWMRAVQNQRPAITRQSLLKTRDAMNQNIPHGLVEGFEPLIETLSLPDEDDRHVLAAAIHAQCDRIVTWNTSDFPLQLLAPHGIALQTPDAFLCELLLRFERDVLDCLHEQRANLNRPPLDEERFLMAIKKQRFTRFAKALEPFKDQL